MNLRELYAYTRRTIRGQYARILGISLVYPMTWLFFRVFPVVLAGMLVMNGKLPAKALVAGGVPLWLLFSVLWAILRFGVLLPLRCGTCGRLTALSGLERGTRTHLKTVSAYLRAAWYFACVELLRIPVLLPFVLGIAGAGYFLHRSVGLAEGGMMLFLAAQCLCVALAGLLYCLHFSIGIAAVPFFWLEYPHISPLEAVRQSREMLQGVYPHLLLHLFCCMSAALPLVTIPFVLPHFMVSGTLFLQVRMREWEQQRTGLVTV